MFNAGRKSGQLDKNFWLLDQKLSSNLHPIIPKKRLWFVSVLNSELNKHTLNHLQAQMISGTSFPVEILILGVFESLRDHVFGLLPAGFMQSLLFTHAKMDFLLLLVGGLLRTLVEKVQLLPVLYIAKSIMLCTSPDAHRTTTIQESSYRFG